MKKWEDYEAKMMGNRSQFQLIEAQPYIGKWQQVIDLEDQVIEDGVWQESRKATD